MDPDVNPDLSRQPPNGAGLAASSMQVPHRTSPDSSVSRNISVLPSGNAPPFVQRNELQVGRRKTILTQKLLRYSLGNSINRPCGVFAMHFKTGRFYDVDSNGTPSGIFRASISHPHAHHSSNMWLTNHV